MKMNSISSTENREPIEQLTPEEAEASLRRLAGISLGASVWLSEVNQERVDVFPLKVSDSSHPPEENMFRTLVEQVPVVTFMAHLGEEENRLYVSPQIETLLGFTQEEWLSDPVLWYERLHPDDQDRWNVEFARFLTMDEPFRSVYRFLARDGHVVWVRGEIKLVRDDAGQPLYIQGVGFDITEIKEAEIALQQAHEQLEKRVEERTAQLAAANEALRAEIAERRRGELMLRRQARDLQRHQAKIEDLNRRLRHSMQETHHRVKNNLQIIAALADMGDDSALPANEDLKRIGRHARTLAAVHDILTHQARNDMEAAALSVREVLERLLNLLKEASKGRTFRIHLEEVRLSTKQVSALAIIVNELVVNALKYGEGDIEVRFAIQDAQARLEVADSGPGFPPHFHPLTSANFGLELVDHMCRSDLNAQARYENRPQGGAHITLTLPLTLE